MNHFKKLRAFLGGLILIGSALPWPAFGASQVYFETSTQVSVATTPATPTRILSGTNGEAYVSLLLNWSGSGTKPNSEFLLLSTSSTSFSISTSTGTGRIPAGNSPSEFFNLGQYQGALYGVVIGTTAAQNVSVFRKK